MLQFHVKAMPCCVIAAVIVYFEVLEPCRKLELFVESHRLRSPGMRARIIQRTKYTLGYQQLGLFLFLL